MTTISDLHPIVSQRTMDTIPERSIETSPAPLPKAIVTLLTNTTYLPGALVLLHALRELHPEPRDFKTVCLVTPETVDAAAMGMLRNAGYDVVIGVEPIASGLTGEPGLHLMGRLDLALALTKLHIFRLGSLFSTVIYMDADTLPLRPISHLFESTSPHILSACPDSGWPDCFNSGVLVVRPRLNDFEGLRSLMMSSSDGGNGSFDGADQGLLNEYFRVDGKGEAWNRLPFTYNVTPSAAYQYAPAYKRFADTISVVHFIGPYKPWNKLSHRPAGSRSAPSGASILDYEHLLDCWYDVYDRNIRPTAAHDPNLAKRFAVPETVAVWEASRDGHVLPSDSPQCPGIYMSLPLDGRVDLMMPRSQTAIHSQSAGTASKDQDHSTALPLSDDHSGKAKIHSQKSSSEESLHHQLGVWDASRRPPPKGSLPEMVVPMTTFYASAWDEPAHAQTEYFRERPDDSLKLPTLPANVKANDWYKQFTGTFPNPAKAHAVFPWETQLGAQPSPNRVFPQPHKQSKDVGDSVAQLSADFGSLLGPSLEAGQPDSVAQSQQLTERGPPLSFAAAMATYTNAWDTLPSIENYARRLTSLGIATERPGTGADRTVPSTPRRAALAQPNSSNDSNEGLSLNKQLPSPHHIHYLDKLVQTERPSQNDAVVQVTPDLSPTLPGRNAIRRVKPVMATSPFPQTTHAARKTQENKNLAAGSRSPIFPSENNISDMPARRYHGSKSRVWDPRRDIEAMV